MNLIDQIIRNYVSFEYLHRYFLAHYFFLNRLNAFYKLYHLKKLHTFFVENIGLIQKLDDDLIDSYILALPMLSARLLQIGQFLLRILPRTIFNFTDFINYN